MPCHISLHRLLRRHHHCRFSVHHCLGHLAALALLASTPASPWPVAVPWSAQLLLALSYLPLHYPSLRYHDGNKFRQQYVFSLFLIDGHAVFFAVSGFPTPRLSFRGGATCTPDPPHLYRAKRHRVSTTPYCKKQ